MKCSSLVASGWALVAAGLMGFALPGCGDATAQADRSGAAEPKEQPAKPKDLPKTSPADPSGGSEKGMPAIKQAADAGKYLFVFFWKTDDEQTAAMKKVFEAAIKKVSDRAQSVAVLVSDPVERGIVDKFGVDRAPMPLVLAMAPNGAITGGFPNKFDEQQLLDAFTTPGTEKVMKQLQDGTLVFVCVQNAKTKSNDVAMQGVRDFKTDVRFADATEIVTLDPTDKKEATFLKDLKVSTDIAEATTVFVAPPGTALGKFEGETNKATFVEALSRANTGCGPGGCGPGGCGPRK